MILVDQAKGSWELQTLLQRQGLTCDKASLAYADACFEGFGPEGLVAVGVERKRLQDMLNCIDDKRYTGHQRVGMARMYAFNFLVVEGYWRPDTRSGLLLWGHPKSDGTMFWTDKGATGQRTMYYKLRRYLFSVSLARVIVLFSRDIGQTAYDIHELYHYFQKPWKDHTALLEMHRGHFWETGDRSDNIVSLPTLDRKPSLTRAWAASLDGVGVKKSEDAARVFRTPRLLANGDETEWLKIPGIGIDTAQRLVRQIGGY